MAALGLRHNVDRVLRNPRWRQSFVIHRMTRTADLSGRAETATEEIAATGVIQPSKGEDLDRLEESDRGDQAVTVWTSTPLTSGTETNLPDEIEWRGTRYMVRHVADWEDYGKGFCRAICVAQSMKDLAT